MKGREQSYHSLVESITEMESGMVTYKLHVYPKASVGPRFHPGCPFNWKWREFIFILKD